MNEAIRNIAEEFVREAMMAWEKREYMNPRAIMIAEDDEDASVYIVDFDHSDQARALHAVRQYTASTAPKAVLFIGTVTLTERKPDQILIEIGPPTAEAIGCIIETPTERLRRIIVINRTTTTLEDHDWENIPDGDRNPMSDFYAYLKSTKRSD